MHFIRMGFVALLMLGPSGCPSNEGPTPNEPDPGGAVALAELRRLVAPDNLDTLGLRSSAEADAATLAEAVPVYQVHLDALRTYSASQDPGVLLSSRNSRVYLVTIGGEVRSQIVVDLTDGTPRPLSFGDSQRARLLAQGLATIASQRRQEPVILVEVAALNLSFLGYRSGEQLRLAPLADVPALGLHAGKDLAAADLWSLLRPEALRHSGLPT